MFGPGEAENKFRIKTVRTNPSKPGVVTGNATYNSFLSSMLGKCVVYLALQYIQKWKTAVKWKAKSNGSSVVHGPFVRNVFSVLCTMINHRRSHSVCKEQQSRHSTSSRTFLFL